MSDTKLPEGMNDEKLVRLVGEDWPVIELGYGAIEVAEGLQGTLPALIFGRNGTGQIGEATPSNRHHLPGETLAVVTFANVQSLDIVAGKLTLIRQRLAAGDQDE